MHAVDPLRIAGMQRRKGGAQAVGGRRNQDQVDMIVHQTICGAAHARDGATRAQGLQIGPAITIGEENGFLPITALYDMVRDIGDNEASGA